MPAPPHPKVRQCTHIKVNGVRCGSPAMKDEFFCFFHTDRIKGVSRRVDARINAIALLEDPDSIQTSIMEVMQGIFHQTIDHKRASQLIKLLHLAFRNVKNVTFEKASTRRNSVLEPPNYAAQYLIEHPEYGLPRPVKNGELFPDGQETQTKFPRARTSPNDEPASSPLAAQPEATPAIICAEEPPAVASETPATKPELVSLQATAARSFQTPPTAEKPCKTVSNTVVRRAEPHVSTSRIQTSEHNVDAEIAKLQRAAAALPKYIPRQPGRSPIGHKKAVRQYNHERHEIFRALAALPGFFKGNVRDVKTLFKFAGIFPAKAHANGSGG